MYRFPTLLVIEQVFLGVHSSTAGSRVPARLPTGQSGVPARTHISVPGTAGKSQIPRRSPGQAPPHAANIAALRRVPAKRCQTTVADGQPAVVSSDSQIRQSLGKVTLANAPDSLPLSREVPLRAWPLAGKPPLPCFNSTFIKYSIGNRIQVGSYNCPCSIFSWQEMQCLAQGTASRRFCCISSWQLAH